MLRTLPLLALLASTAAAQCFSVTTAPWGNNGQNGTMFDVVNISANPIDVIGFDQVFFSAGTNPVEIYTAPGTWNGQQGLPGNWTLVGGPTAVTHGALANGALPLPIPISVTIAPGATQAFYVTTTNGTVAYTTGVNQLGASIGTDGTIDIRAGVGVVYPFGSTFGLPTAGRLFMGIVRYSMNGAVCVASTKSSYGTGCVSQPATPPDSFYENFAAGAHDLSNSAMMLVRSSTQYLAVPSAATIVPPSGGAQVLALTDDSETTVVLSSAMPVGRTSSTSQLTVCSNGFVSVASGNGVAFSPSVATMLNAPHTGWWCWHDFNPAIVGSGQVKFEEVAGVAYVTWDGVWDFGGTSAANANTMQFQFDLATGNVTVVWGQMSNLGNGHLVGYSEGGASADPGGTDISAALPGSFVAGNFSTSPLGVDSQLPVAGTVINVTTTNVPSSAPFGALLVGLTQFNPGIDLTGIGMAGCFQYNDALVTQLFLPGGANTVVTPFSVPNAPGLHLQLQSAVYAPAEGLTLLGAISSQGMDLGIGTY